MRLVKKNTQVLEKCYSIAELSYKGERHIVVAAEKVNNCLLLSLDGDLEDVIWSEPGGTMSLVPLEDRDGCFLATQKMYSPNDSKEAKIVFVSPKEEGGWNVDLVSEVPFVHRFDVLKAADGTRYLIGSTIKSAHEYKEDWRFPGQYLAAKLPEDFGPGVTVKLEVVKAGLLRNHGYIRRQDKDGDYSVISSDNGVFEMHPPVAAGGEWKTVQLTSDPTSDICFVDFDGDGKDEMIALSPFHGDTLALYHQKDDGTYGKIFELEEKKPFLHSLFAGVVQGKPVAIIGHRKGESRDLLGFTYSDGKLAYEVLDKDSGSTNVMYYRNGEKDMLVSANREINEIAFYEIEV